MGRLRDEASDFARTASDLSADLTEWYARLIRATAQLFGAGSTESAEVRSLSFELPPEFIASIERRFGDHPDAERLIAAQRRVYLQKQMIVAVEVVAALLHALRRRQST